jgi:hypothetical protein
MITPIWSQWENLNGPEAGSVYSLDAVNGELWAGTERGIFISRDNGDFWRATNIIPQNHKVYDIFVSGNEILLLTETFDKTTKNYQFQLKYSSDSGKTWDNKNLPAVSFSYPFNYRLSKSSDRFYIRDFSSIYSSSDNGSTWTTIKPNNNPNATASSISVSGDRIVASASNKMYLSSDGGATWSTNGYNPVSGVFVDNDLIIANYKSPDSLLVSNDFGTTWTVQGNGYLPVKRIKRGQDGNLYTYNDSGQVGYSTNNGQSWLYYGITTRSKQGYFKL